MNKRLKDAVKEYWDKHPCGEVYATGDDLRTRLEAQAAARYRLEPYIEEFGRFNDAGGKDVLEVGVGVGVDHARFARAQPSHLAGVDLSPKAVDWTRQRLNAYGLSADLQVADAEELPFPDSSFSMVYSWGVLHHTPDTQRAIEEVRRVLVEGGCARIMLYNRYSVIGFMLWARYSALTGIPLAEIYGKHLESPGTKGFTRKEARTLFSGFRSVTIRPQLSFADLMQGSVGAKHNASLMRVASYIWPRRLIERFLAERGQYLLVDAVK